MNRAVVQEERMRSPAKITEPAVPVERAALLTLDGLTKRFGDHTAVRPVSLEIRAGEFVTLLGPSGCGKTTLLRMIAGLEEPTAGRVLVGDRDVTRMRPERRPFNMVFQSYALFPHLNVFDNVAYGLRAAGRSEAEIARTVGAALAMVGLEQHGEKAIGQLSGGMSQRVALVRAIVNEPAVLLLDEPLAALDLQLRKRMQVELRAIQRRIGTTFVHVTHDQEEALVMSDRIVVMQSGSVVQVGPPREVYRHPRTRFVADFVGEAALIPCRVGAERGAEVSALLPSGRKHVFAHYGDVGLGAGDAGFVSLRPEDLAPALPGAGVLEGTVTNIIFTGRASDCVVALDTGGEVRVRLAPDEEPALGATLGIDIRPGCGVFVRADDQSIEDETQ